MQLDIHNTPNFKGYTALLAENTDPENRGDLHEGFDIGWEGEDADRGAMTGTNVWPREEDVPGFRAAALAY
jgi:isopenicillin N synthase-like dioxygenase